MRNYAADDNGPDGYPRQNVVFTQAAREAIAARALESAQVDRFLVSMANELRRRVRTNDD